MRRAVSRVAQPVTASQTSYPTCAYPIAFEWNMDAHPTMNDFNHIYSSPIASTVRTCSSPPAFAYTFATKCVSSHLFHHMPSGSCRPLSSFHVRLPYRASSFSGCTPCRCALLACGRSPCARAERAESSRRSNFQGAMHDRLEPHELLRARCAGGMPWGERERVARAKADLGGVQSYGAALGRG